MNLTDVAIDSVHVILNPALERRSLSFSRAADHVFEDEDFKYHIFALEQPLSPGDSTRMTFDLASQPEGFGNGLAPTEVVRNGAYFDRDWLPIIGYQRTFEIADRRTRERVGLPERRGVPDRDDAEALRHRSGLRDADLVHIETIIGTPEGNPPESTRTIPSAKARRGT